MKVFQSPYVLSWLVSTTSLVTLWGLFSLPITLSVWLSGGILLGSYFLFKGLEDDEPIESKIWDLKSQIEDINKEMTVNWKYLEEYKEYFNSEKITTVNVKRYVDILIFKNIFLTTSVETKIYDIQKEISSLFSKIDDLYTRSKTNEKENIVKSFEKMNDLKWELDSLLRVTKKNIISLMKENLADIKETKEELEKLDSKDLGMIQNITILTQSYNTLQERIKNFK